VPLVFFPPGTKRVQLGEMTAIGANEENLQRAPLPNSTAGMVFARMSKSYAIDQLPM
jgi:hypothetical protein